MRIVVVAHIDQTKNLHENCFRCRHGSNKIYPYKQIYQFPQLSVFQIGLWCHDRINKKTRVIGYNDG